jgi:hypothetical protein
MKSNPEMMKEEISRLKELKTDEEIEEWLAKQGGNVISSLGQEVDRIEVTLKVRFKPHPRLFVAYCSIRVLTVQSLSRLKHLK